MLARRRTTILPDMTLAEAIDTTRIHRVAGRTGDSTAMVATRRSRAPHYTVAGAGLIGGGQVSMPGEGSTRARPPAVADVSFPRKRTPPMPLATPQAHPC
jgi:predicted ATPase with chaperone activity